MQAEREDDGEMGAAMKEILVRGCCGGFVRGQRWRRGWRWNRPEGKEEKKEKK